MELLQLRYFVEVAEKESITKAAEKLYVSPSAISGSISRLETELGATLFDRIGRKIIINEKGKTYLSYIKRALDDIDIAGNLVSSVQTEDNNTLRLVMTSPFAWQDALFSFSSKYPNIKIFQRLFDPIIFGAKTPGADIDCWIASPNSHNEPGWDKVVFLHDKIGLAVPPGHKFYNRKSIHLSEAADENFIVMPDCYFSRSMEDLCHEAGFNPKVLAKTDAMLRPSIAIKNNAVSLTTLNVARSGFYVPMHIIPLEDKNATRIEAVYYPKNKVLPAAAKLFIDSICEYYKNYNPLDYVDC